MDYYRLNAANPNISLDSLPESALRVGQPAIAEHSIVRETMEALGDREKQILYLFSFKNLSQEAISRQLDIPVGTVKSRLHYARKQFRSRCSPENLLLLEKGRKTMQKKIIRTAFRLKCPLYPSKSPPRRLLR